MGDGKWEEDGVDGKWEVSAVGGRWRRQRDEVGGSGMGKVGDNIHL